jgi:hypothetical protein
MYIVAGIEDAPATVVWLSKSGVHQAVLEAVPDTAPRASPSAAPSPAGSGASAEPTVAP